MFSLIVSVTLAACLQMPAEPPAIAIIIDDLGYRPDQDEAAIAAPELTTVAILPFTALTARLAESAHRAGKEVLLHLPMEATHDNHLLGPGALRKNMAQAEFVRAVHAALDNVPYRIGMNNHMGSLLTQDRERMQWLMDALSSAPGLMYVDSRTTARSTARSAAREAHVPYLARDVFLDNERDAAYIEARFEDLVARAQTHGEALGIAHPHPETLSVLRRRLPALVDAEQVPLTRLLERRQCRAARAELRALSDATAQRKQRRADAEAAEYPHAER